MYFATGASLLAVLIALTATSANPIDPNAVEVEDDYSCQGNTGYYPDLKHEQCGSRVPMHESVRAIVGLCSKFGACVEGSGTYPNGSYTYDNITASISWGPKCGNYHGSPTNVTKLECRRDFFYNYFAGADDIIGICPFISKHFDHWTGGTITFCDGTVMSLEEKS